MTRHLTLFVLLLLCAAVWAIELTTTPTQYLILKPKNPIAIDGKLDDWDMAHTPYTISANGKNPMNGVFVGYGFPVKSDEDFSGRAALAWDENYLYVAGEMVDDHLVGVKPNSYGNQGPAGWFCDSLMIFMASYRQPMKRNSPFHAYPILGVRYAVEPGGRGTLAGTDAILDKRDLYWVLTQNSKWAFAETPNGYRVEAAIPWKDLDFVARPGERLFLAFLAADTDPGETLKQVGWGFDNDNPKGFPAFRLADQTNALGLLSASADEVSTDQPWSIHLELDALAGKVQLTSIRIIDAKGGRVIAEQRLKDEVPQGKTGTGLLELKAGAIAKPGEYRIEEVALINGSSRVVASVPVTVVPPKGQVMQSTGAVNELHHTGPGRTVLNAIWESGQRHAPVTGKEDYVEYIRRYVEPGLKGTAQNWVKQKYPHAYMYPFHCMAMYKITGDAEYAKLASDIMDYMLESGEMGWFKLTAICQYRYLTWMKDPNSPFAPKDAEKRFRANLAKVAANPDMNLFAESGTHNRVWHRYAMLKMARIVAEQDKLPLDPKVIEYTDYHDKLIGEVGDSDDASPNYHWVFFDAAIGIYLFTGDWDGFLKNKGYQKTLSRYVEMVTPSGACPQFASCNGWHMVGESMWAYELMSSLTKDGRYRWTSHRIAEYYYNHLYFKANQYHLPYDEAKNNFVLSYLLADDAVKPKEPAAGSRITWRHPLRPVAKEILRNRIGTSPLEIVPDQWIPDKVVLSSNNQPNGLWGLVELLPIAGHGGELPGAIFALTQNDAALLAGQGYYENTPDFQNIMWVEDLEGVPADNRFMDTTVPIFVEDPNFTFVRIQTDRFLHLPVTYTRDLFFFKNGFIVVKDRVKYNQAMKTRLGPCFQTRDLGPQSGENWFNTYYDELYYTGLGLGRGVQVIKNPAWDLMVYFTPRAEYKQTMLDRFSENPYRCSPVQLRQAWSGIARPGQEFTFTTVLLPHAPVLAPKDLLDPPADVKDVSRIEVVRDDNDVTILKVISEAGNQPRNITYLMLNTSGAAVKTDLLESDGFLAMVNCDKNGRLLSRALAGGNLLRFQAKDESAAARKYQLAPLTLPVSFMK
ncbi:MAG: sugar-binding protein [Armatimonadota bacterium]